MTADAGKQGGRLPRVTVLGAGPAGIAAAYALTKDASIMAKLANLAGGLVCEQVGTSPIDRERLEQESSKLGWC